MRSVIRCSVLKAKTWSVAREIYVLLYATIPYVYWRAGLKIMGLLASSTGKHRTQGSGKMKEKKYVIKKIGVSKHDVEIGNAGNLAQTRENYAKMILIPERETPLPKSIVETILRTFASDSSIHRFYS